MVICSGSTQTSGGTALLYTTDTLELQEDGHGGHGLAVPRPGV